MSISGLTLIPNIISIDEENHIIKYIESEPWNSKLKRLTQHYGYEYNYSNPYHLVPTITPPEWLQSVIKILIERNLFTKPPEQIIINRYLPGEGIAHHVDSKIFCSTICSVSLGSGCDFEFIHSQHGYRIYYLESRCGMIMSDEARYDWKHGIAKKKTDTVMGKRKYRSTRYSITFRWIG